ncbi:hypothetical protein L5849_05065 [Erythrobacter sp. SN021]|uniref:hypothetical protein n=1 Tax=Erythrobacter sp. SN021 TaxID=2912574 RepID=UPI001F199E4E|nr:hypothetical protein [Erythrobacter sp. SN021]MCF8882068.1 hypothetical protein [Erythrobacter sp. SN021]
MGKSIDEIQNLTISTTTTLNAQNANVDCLCITLDTAALVRMLDERIGEPGFGEAVLASHPHLFSSSPVFVDREVLDRMMLVVEASEAVAHNPGFRSTALGYAPPISAHDFGIRGLFMGYDFHLTADGPKLIEINTNAGGAFLNAILADAQESCCPTAETAFLAHHPSRAFDDQIASIFEEEWRTQRGTGRPGRIAIIDEEPQSQLLYPEFLAARTLLENAGFAVDICSPEQLSFSGHALMLNDQPVDFVYNRLVDFALQEPTNGALRKAYLSGRVVVSPNPHVHALYADKRNLVFLSDRNRLIAHGVSETHAGILHSAVPETLIVEPDNASTLWKERRAWFFKPAGGYGSKAAYRGAKLTKKVWEEIVRGGYVAQRYTAPSLRRVSVAGEPVDLKVDIRLYTYAGRALMAAARLYQGQTTNMRTSGGGFAPVLSFAAPV